MPVRALSCVASFWHTILSEVLRSYLTPLGTFSYIFHADFWTCYRKPITKPPNHQTTKQPNHQTTKPPNHQTIKPPNLWPQPQKQTWCPLLPPTANTVTSKPSFYIIVILWSNSLAEHGTFSHLHA